ncbi:MAG: hypothetical protein JKY03_03660, partial [Aureispira sp.]|nr:hypothetical protein [Aureispira sp.]
IGSYVYLRRIFEYLINQAYEKAKKEGTVKESDYMAVRVDERIELLKGYLPEFLVKNKSMYSILSLGIHELDEAKCLAHFPTLQIGIEIILDEQLEIKKREEKNNLAEKKIRDLKGKINQK